MNVSGYALRLKSDNSIIINWVTVPGRIDLPNGDVLMGADSGWDNGTYLINAATWTVADPTPAVPQIISDRQFFQQLAVMGVITQDEALAAVGPGTLPASLSGLVSALPSDQQFPANMLLKGAVQFDRQHPLVGVLASAFGWSDAQLDALWTAAAVL